jgi:hypothetical protein
LISITSMNVEDVNFKNEVRLSLVLNFVIAVQCLHLFSCRSILTCHFVDLVSGTTAKTAQRSLLTEQAPVTVTVTVTATATATPVSAIFSSPPSSAYRTTRPLTTHGLVSQRLQRQRRRGDCAVSGQGALAGSGQVPSYPSCRTPPPRAPRLLRRRYEEPQCRHALP